MDTPYQYPPELMSLLIDAIPRLCRSKDDVLLFFRGAGVPEKLASDIRDRVLADRTAITKAEMARTVLTRLNEGGDAYLALRREVIRRAVEFQDFSHCWPGDRLEAQGLVARVRQVVDVKDSFTRMRMEREAERDARKPKERERLSAVQHRREALAAVSDELRALFREKDPNKHGKALESVLTRFFGVHDLLVREPFTLKRPDGAGIMEQVDGAVEFDGHLYLVEMKWWTHPLRPADVAPHLVKVFSRHGARGLLISASEYTEGAIQECRNALAHKVIVLCRLEEIVRLFEQEGDLRALLRAKVSAAIADKEPLFGPSA